MTVVFKECHIPAFIICYWLLYLSRVNLFRNSSILQLSVYGWVSGINRYSWKPLPPHYKAKLLLRLILCGTEQTILWLILVSVDHIVPDNVDNKILLPVDTSKRCPPKTMIMESIQLNIMRNWSNWFNNQLSICILYNRCIGELMHAAQMTWSGMQTVNSIEKNKTRNLISHCYCYLFFLKTFCGRSSEDEIVLWDD